MKVIIAGGRDYVMTIVDAERINDLLPQFEITEVVSGGAKGADAGGEILAKLFHLPLKRFPADWKKYGKAAGPIRNNAMADYADAVILFPGGHGTESMYLQAIAADLIIYDWRGL